jgi:tetratricopeptide (TPR) repeat protein
VTRRRTEAGVLTILSLATVFWTGFALPKVIPEITSAFSPVSLPMTCIGSKEPDALRVIIVDFDEVGPQPQFLLEDRLFDDLSERLEGDMAICRLQQVVSLRSEALALGERTQAAIIVWGRSDVVFEAHIEVAGWDLPGRDLPPLPSEDVAKSTFVIREQIHLGFLTEFTFSEILYLDNQIERAQQVLNEALTRAEQQGLSEDNAADMAEAYYLQGFLSKESPKPDFQQAVVAYSKAFELDPTFYAAILNRGEVYRQLGEDENARADYELLIEEHTSLASSAYINLALLVTESDQGAAERYFVSAIKLNPLEGYWYRGNVRLYKWNDPEGAVDDFNEAVKLKPGAYFFYHSLGQAQLIAGQTDNAIETYQEIIVYLDEDARQEVIKELKALSQQRPHLNESITGIIRSLQEATLP